MGNKIYDSHFSMVSTECILLKENQCKEVKDYVNAIKYLFSCKYPFCPENIIGRSFSVFKVETNSDMLISVWVIQIGSLLEGSRIDRGFCNIVKAIICQNLKTVKLELQLSSVDDAKIPMFLSHCIQGEVSQIANMKEVGMKESLHTLFSRLDVSLSQHIAGDYSNDDNDDDNESNAIKIWDWNHCDDQVKKDLITSLKGIAHVFRRDCKIEPIKELLKIWFQQYPKEHFACIWICNNHLAIAIFYRSIIPSTSNSSDYSTASHFKFPITKNSMANVFYPTIPGDLNALLLDPFCFIGEYRLKALSPICKMIENVTPSPCMNYNNGRLIIKMIKGFLSFYSKNGNFSGITEFIKSSLVMQHEDDAINI